MADRRLRRRYHRRRASLLLRAVAPEQDREHASDGQSDGREPPDVYTHWTRAQLVSEPDTNGPARIYTRPEGRVLYRDSWMRLSEHLVGIELMYWTKRSKLIDLLFGRSGAGMAQPTAGC